MATLKNLKHYNDILWLAYKYGQNDLIRDLDGQLDMPKIIKEKGVEKGKADDLVKDLESLGPFYIKLGQVLSSEVDLLPAEYDEALHKLQDNAEPMPYEDVESIIIAELGKTPEQLFKSFHREPLSAASLGQVHEAILPSGKKVAVKVQRKDIQKTILEQLEAFKQICTFLENNSEWGKKYQILQKFGTLETILLKELDYTKEANNLKILARNLQEFEKMVVPLPVDKYTTSRVLTMDYISGKKITELDDDYKTTERTELARDLFYAFLKQILVDGFFQMDPHPGNVYLTFVEDKPKLALFDLGMVAQIPLQMQGKLTQCLFGLSESREDDVTQLLLSLGKKTSNFDEFLFRSKISDVLASYRGLTISQVPMGKVVLKLSYIAAEAGLKLPIQFSLIGKALLSLSPVLSALDPHFDPNVALQEKASELINQRLSQQFSYQALYGTILSGAEFLQHLPGRLNEVFDLLTRNDYQLKLRFLESDAFARNFEKIANRIAMGLILSALVISSALLMKVDTPAKIFGYPAFAMGIFITAVIGAFLLIATIIWNDRKRK